MPTATSWAEETWVGFRFGGLGVEENQGGEEDIGEGGETTFG